ncbi:NEDD4-binding protein 2-like 2 isoform X2 [Alexandromys fortis]|uniref:NEDD4-binding protein 2-like 2 isoform X2 n=1 Tax=Alexandromys fortis TaxID=100897 RepID=UPI0021527C0E|nr:NEDD4-binding protein 2-like 2 isoform X2 [Microtus fortis]
MASCSALMTIFIIKMGTAKQAIDQGRSPVIIDNTNTQAWEMKPYVEMAIGKGYRVEFHEPETWWKFDPEELEKRNKHGVSRKKIAQMLDRYEFQMSISIVMNSVEPSQKSIQRPLPLPEEPRGRVLKKSGYRPDKPKEKRNRKGKKRNNSFSENSLATLGHLAPGSLGRSQSEGEGFEETERAPGHPFAGSLQNEADRINNNEEQSWQDIEISNNSQNGVSTAELDHTPKNCFPEEEEDLVLTLPSVPSGSSASCHTSTQHLSCVGRDRCSGMRVEKHMSNRHKSALDTQDIFAKTPCSFPQKMEMKDKSRLDEHGGTRTSEEVLREEQGVKSNCWAFFTASLSDEELQIRSKSQPYFGSWPKGPHEFVYEQRPKKNRSQRLTFPESEEQLIQLISTSEGAAVSGNCPEIPMKKQLGDLSAKAEMVDLPRNPETNTFSTCVPHPISLEHPLESARGTQGMQRRICNLPPVNPEAKEKCDLLTEHHELNMFLAEEDISKMINKDETKQKMIIDGHLPWYYLDTLHDSPRSIVQQSCSYRLSFNRVGCAVYFYKNPVPSLMLHYLSSFCMLSFNNRRALLTFKSQKSMGRTLTDGGFILSDVLSGQPATFCSLRISPDTQFLNEKLDEELKTQEGREPVRCLPAEDSQDLISRNHQCYGPLSQELAFHPVKHFESPGVPIESLLPDDHVVPFDWKTLKIIPLPWKMPL